NNIIGGIFLFVDPGNTVSGNQLSGIRLGDRANDLAADNNVIRNNNIGTDPDGTSAIPNGDGAAGGGIRIDEGTGNEILDNVIAGNNTNGIRLRGSSPSNIIRENKIGVDANGDPLGNDFRGIWVQTDNNTIGGSNSGNVIGSNSLAGVLIEGGSNSVDENLVGVDSSGTDIGNGADGIAVFGDSNSIDNNAIGNNSGVGILLRDATANEVVSNHIGRNASGASAPNEGGGVFISATSGNSSGDNVIGGSEAANVVANNRGDGVRIGGNGSATRNPVRYNQIYDNTDLGIDLRDDGRTTNDPGDGDDGPNRLQNYPVLRSSNYDSGADAVTVTYLVPSDPDTSTSGASLYPLAIDIYVADAEGEEGRTYIGTESYTANDYRGCDSPPCTVTKTFTPQSSVNQDDELVATATDDEGNTSEFSKTVNDPPVARPDSFATDEGQTLTVMAPGVLDNDSDPDGDPLEASLVSGVS
ncbi:MAG: right-handed parallel beta-helix repeat-containing protein, partial [Salinibacter sp.]|uniref:right-handed parallel beta-helix repeat-containing protein n=1 Tax=Salinibacter sp. TaxID=2065818 RepID=UPI0035D4A0C3